ncbi:Hypothetical protein RY67_15 [Bifidobacterium longum subsp. infantis]|uniref:Uncharacterized protein n=1 Tax=Bifidobacterium longum subsp. infantis TaxID=1682 RepID=A0A0M4MES8_BIFLI|nr:Hypothetical protein RY67_15 [Bifidobacterium longum subsp. infantis]
MVFRSLSPTKLAAAVTLEIIVGNSMNTGMKKYISIVYKILPSAFTPELAA